MRAHLLALLAPLAGAFRIPFADEVDSFASLLVDETHGSAHTVLTPASDITLESITSDDFHVLVSAENPQHKVRIKSTTGWCDPHARSYSGYLDVGYGKELYFAYFESRRDPSTDPVMMWINGGPGGSSAMGLYGELGPCTVNPGAKSANDTTPNPHSWNNEANIFFLDQPISVGFSHAHNGQQVSNTHEAAKDVVAFIQIFFETFKELEGRALHLSGESYGGRYLPVFASALHDANAGLVAAGKTPINLQSVLIGNGLPDLYSMLESFHPLGCTPQEGINGTILNIDQCIALRANTAKCLQLSTKHCLDTHDPVDCGIAFDYCMINVFSASTWVHLNPYDARLHCYPGEPGCYSFMEDVEKYLNLPDVQHKLGIPKGYKYTMMTPELGARFFLQQDWTYKTWEYVAELLERGVRVLNFVGMVDWVCNHVGQEIWIEKFDWTGKAAFNAEKLVDWEVDGKKAGYVKSHGPLTFLKILDAGHMVPMDQPANSAAFLKAWMDNGVVK